MGIKKLNPLCSRYVPPTSVFKYFKYVFVYKYVSFYLGNKEAEVQAWVQLHYLLQRSVGMYHIPTKRIHLVYIYPSIYLLKTYCRDQ